MVTTSLQFCAPCLVMFGVPVGTTFVVILSASEINRDFFSPICPCRLNFVMEMQEIILQVQTDILTIVLFSGLHVLNE